MIAHCIHYADTQTCRYYFSFIVLLSERIENELHTWRPSSDTAAVSFTFTSCHTWQFIIFAVFSPSLSSLSSSLTCSVFPSELKTWLFSRLNPFNLRPFFTYRTDSRDSDHLTFLFCSSAGFVCMVC